MLKEDSRNLQGQLLRKQAAAASKEALKRISMVRNLFDMADTFLMEVGITGRAGYASQAAALVEASAAAHDRLVDQGVSAGVLHHEVAVANSCTPEDRQWLRSQLRADSGTSRWTCLDLSCRAGSKRNWKASCHIISVTSNDCCPTGPT